MYTIGLILSFKIALLISIFLVAAKLFKEAKFFRECGLADSHIKRFYKENLASSCSTVGQLTFILGSLFSLISMATIWVVD